jgi:acetyltransferase
VLATDTLIAGGGELAVISPETMQELDDLLPAPWSHGNPIDVLGDADPERYAKTLETAARDPESDGLLVVLTPQDMTEPTETAQGLVPYAHDTRKPVLASWMGGAEVAAGTSILNGAGIPTFDYPDDAARSFTNMWRYTYNLRGIYETPQLADGPDVDRERAEEIVAGVREGGRTILTEFESKALLAAYGIPTVERRRCRRACRVLRLPRRPQAKLADHNPQDRRWRRAPEPPERRRGARGLRGDGVVYCGEILAGGLRGRHRAADGEP